MVIFWNNTVNLRGLLVLEKVLEIFSTIFLTFKKETALVILSLMIFMTPSKLKKKNDKQTVVNDLFYSCHLTITGIMIHW